VGRCTRLEQSGDDDDCASHQLINRNRYVEQAHLEGGREGGRERGEGRKGRNTTR